MRRSEILACLLFMLLGAHVVTQATGLPYLEKYGPGPGFLPFWLGWAWIALSIVHFANILLQPGLYKGPQPFPWGTPALRVAGVYVTLLVTTFLMGALGFLIALSFMGLALLVGVERRPWKQSLAVALGVAVCTWLLFAVFLGVPFPKGPLGI